MAVTEATSFSKISNRELLNLWSDRVAHLGRVKEAQTQLKNNPHTKDAEKQFAKAEAKELGDETKWGSRSGILVLFSIFAYPIATFGVGFAGAVAAASWVLAQKRFIEGLNQ